MIDPNLDHDEQTEPNNERPTPPPPDPEGFHVLAREKLAELAELAELGELVTIEGETLRELVRLYQRVSSVAHSMDHIARISEGLEKQVSVAELVADQVQRGRRQRFEILLRWARKPTTGHYTCTGWHETAEGMRWSGTYDEADHIVRERYAPIRGREAYIVVRVDS